MDRFLRALLALVLLRWVLDLLFWLDVIPLARRVGPLLYHGGDQLLMMDMAYLLRFGILKPAAVNIGQPLMLLPWSVILNTAIYDQVVIPATIINGFLFGGLSILVLGWLARHLIGQSAPALWAAALWAAIPLISYGLFFWHPEFETLRSITVPRWSWLVGLSDPPAAFFTMLAVLLLARVVDQGRQAPFWPLVWAGAAMGLAVVFRIHMAFVVIFLLAYVWIAHGWRALLAAGGGGLVAYLPQACYNQVVFGVPFWSGYFSLDAVNSYSLRNILAIQPFSLGHLGETLQSVLAGRAWALPLAGGALAGLVIAGLLIRQRRGTARMALLIGPALAYLGPMMASYPFREDVIRFSMPAIPFLIVLGVCFLVIFGQWLASQRRRMPAQP